MSNWKEDLKQQTKKTINKASPEDACIPKSGKLRKEIQYYDPGVKVCWDPKAWMNQPQCQVWLNPLTKVKLKCQTRKKVKVNPLSDCKNELSK